MKQKNKLATKKKEILKKRATVGVFYLAFRRIVVQIILTLSNIALARLLFPSDFGTFAVVSFVVIFAQAFSDIGFGASLVQKKQSTNQKDFQSAFSVQLFLTLFLVLVIFAASGRISSFYKFDQLGINLLKIYALTLFTLPLKNISVVILERELFYKKLISAELLEFSITQALIVSFAFLGFGVFSFAWGSLLGRLVSIVFYFYFAPWSVSIKISAKSLSSLAKFGLPYQMNLILGLFYGPLIFLYLGKVVGSQNFGFYQFAASLTVFPLAIPEIINRIVFPLGSRLQEDRVFLGKIVEKSINAISAISLPLVFITAAIVPEIIHFIYTDKWLPALPAIYISLLQIAIILYTGLFTQFILVLGHASVMRNMSFVWAILTWLFSPVLIFYFNFVGMSIASLLVSMSGIWLFFRLKREIRFSFGENFFPYFFSAFASGLWTAFLLRILQNSFIGLILALLLGILIYGMFAIFLGGKELFSVVKYFISFLKESES